MTYHLAGRAFDLPEKEAMAELEQNHFKYLFNRLEDFVVISDYLEL